jgi:hypothetical protein
MIFLNMVIKYGFYRKSTRCARKTQFPFTLKMVYCPQGNCELGIRSTDHMGGSVFGHRWNATDGPVNLHTRFLISYFLFVEILNGKDIIKLRYGVVELRRAIIVAMAETVIMIIIPPNSYVY